jgi:hypothetical protein
MKPMDVYNPKVVGNMANNYMGSRYQNLYSTLAMVNSQNQGMPIHTMRLMMFRDYELMDQDPILHSALDLYSEECAIRNEFGEIVKIKCEDEEINEVLHNLFYNVLNVNFNLRSWVRSFVKYGDFFMKLNIVDKLGIVDTVTMSPYDVTRVEEVNKSTGKIDTKYAIEGYKFRGELQPYEMAHFRLQSDINFLPYGKSAIEGARRVWKQLNLAEDAMLIHRIIRAPQKRVFSIEVGNLNANEVDPYMKNMINSMKKVPLIDEQTGDYNLKYNIQNITEDFYLPVRNGESGNKIDTLEALGNETIEDIEYFKNKMFAALRIPKAWLGFEESVGSKSLLSAEDVRFARTIENMQAVIVGELTKIAKIHLFAQGYNEDDLESFTISLNSPSIVYEQEKLELWKGRIELADSIRAGKMLSEKWIYENIYQMTSNEIESQKEEVLNDAHRDHRLTQIVEQGNDPNVSGEHATDTTSRIVNKPDDVQYAGPTGRGGGVASPQLNQGGKPQPEGAPVQRGSNYGTDKSTFGRDALGKNKAPAGLDKSTGLDFKNNSPLATEDEFTELHLTEEDEIKFDDKMIDLI